MDADPWTIGYCCVLFNPFTLRVPLESIVCNFHTFENNLEIKQQFKEYLMESCCVTSGQHFSLKSFQEKYFQNCQACFGRSKCEWVKMYTTCLSICNNGE